MKELKYCYYFYIIIIYRRYLFLSSFIYNTNIKMIARFKFKLKLKIKWKMLNNYNCISYNKKANIYIFKRVIDII